MAYTDIDDPSAYFQTTLYSGTGSEQSITNTGNSDLQPDWVWMKVRSNGTYGHANFDSVRGVNQFIGSNVDNSEEDQSSDVSLSAFNSDGFTVGGYFNFANQSGQTFVSWQWKAGTSFTNDASSTSVGSIDSAGSVSTTAGFSIITYTGTGSAATVAHGLGSAPRMIIIKDRSNSRNWGVYHQSMGNLDAIYLDLTNEKGGNSSAFWNSTSPTSSVFSINTRNEVNASSANMVAYCFAEKQGYSKFGSYIPNANVDGAFVYTGFKPAFLLIKNTSQATDWIMYDNKRDGYEPQNKEFRANTSAAERNAEDNNVQFCANGFKLRNAGTKSNADAGNTLIYMAFAEQPFVTSTGVPGTAR